MVSSTLGSLDQHRLEPPLQRRVLLDVLAVLVERRGADRAQLAAREHRLQHVAGVHGALGRARADDRVQLVDERDDLALAVGDLLQHGLEPLLELAAVLRAGDHRAEVERDDALVLQRARGRRRRRCAARGPRRWRSCPRRARRSAPGCSSCGARAPGSTRRISSSRPMTGSSLPRRASSVRSRPYFSSAWYFSSGFWSVTRWRPRTSASAASTPSRVRPASRRIRADVRRRHPERQEQVLGGDVLVGERFGLAAGAVQQPCRWRARCRDLGVPPP